MKPRWSGEYGEPWTRERQAMETARQVWPIHEAPSETRLRSTLLMGWVKPRTASTGALVHRHYASAHHGSPRSATVRTLDRLPSMTLLDYLHGKVSQNDAGEV